MNKYDTITLGEMDAMIGRVALMNLRTPLFDLKKDAAGNTYTLAEISNYNSLIAAHNEGVRDLADMLKKELKRYGDQDDSK